MISEGRALEIAKEYLTREGSIASRRKEIYYVMDIHYKEISPIKYVTQIRYTKKSTPRYFEVPVWEVPVWLINYFWPESGAAGMNYILVNAKTGELLEDFSPVS